MKTLPLPRGFRAAGLHAGVKRDGAKDMALIVSDRPATVAGTFTTNQVCAAPVKVCRERLRAGGPGRAVVVNSGNANACTGARGLADAERMCALAAAATGAAVEEVFVCSTGSIGVPLPMPAIESGIAALADALGTDGIDAADSILTTDTRRKVARRELGGGSLVAFAKGAGMIEPNMATMLCYVLTDLEVPDPRPMLSEAVARSFNRISVDGDMSTNDTVLMLANGASGSPAPPGFQETLNEMLLELALDIVDDGEGTSKVVTIDVAGARDDLEADTVARTVANSLLVKTAWAGSYPSWGRIMDAVGYSRAKVVEENIHIHFDDTEKVRGGLDTGADERASTQAEAFTVRIDLGLGDGGATVYTTDCTEDYVRLNKD